MADSELGEVRRPARDAVERVMRATGYLSQGMAAGANDTVSPLEENDEAGLLGDGGGSDDGADVPSWHSEHLVVTASTSTWTLDYTPADESEILRLNGLTLVRDVDYTIDGKVVTFDDPTALFDGVGSWTLAATYPHYDEALGIALEVVYTASADGNVVTIPEAPSAQDICLLVTQASSSGAPTGGWTTWTKVYDSPINGTTGYGSGVDVWMGTAPSSGTSVTFANGFPNVLTCIRGAEDLVVADVSSGFDSTPGSSIDTGTAQAIEGDLVLAGLKTTGRILVYVYSDGTSTETGYTGDFLADDSTSSSGHSTALSVGVADADGSVSCEFGLTSDSPGSGDVEAVILVLREA